MILAKIKGLKRLSELKKNWKQVKNEFEVFLQLEKKTIKIFLKIKLLYNYCNIRTERLHTENVYCCIGGEMV